MCKYIYNICNICYILYIYIYLEAVIVIAVREYKPTINLFIKKVYKPFSALKLQYFLCPLTLPSNKK